MINSTGDSSNGNENNSRIIGKIRRIETIASVTTMMKMIKTPSTMMLKIIFLKSMMLRVIIKNDNVSLNNNDNKLKQCWCWR